MKLFTDKGHWATKNKDEIILKKPITDYIIDDN